jgi:hypothetical protein
VGVVVNLMRTCKLGLKDFHFRAKKEIFQITSAAAGTIFGAHRVCEFVCSGQVGWFVPGWFGGSEMCFRHS